MAIIKVAILSDSHWDINSRWEETLRVHDWFANDVRERQVDLVLHAGDFGPLVPIRQFKPEERLAVSDWLRKITDYCPFVGVRGNHDVSKDLSIFNQLHTEQALEILETPSVTYLTVRNGGQIAIAGMPWPVKAEILARIGERSGEEVAGATADAMRSVFLGLGTRLRELHMPSVLLMHAMVRASRVSTGQPIAPGQDFEIGQEDIGLVGADFNALGHVHLSQAWTWDNKPIAYCGSPRRTNFGETEEKSYVLLEFDGQPDPNGGWACSWQRIPVPCTPMLLLEAVFSPEHGLVWQANESLPLEGGIPPDWKAIAKGAEIRLRYRVDADQRTVAKQAVSLIESQLRECGAVNVMPEPQVIPVTHARAPEVAKVLTIKDQLPILWATQNDIPPADKQDRLFTKLAELERQVQCET